MPNASLYRSFATVLSAETASYSNVGRRAPEILQQLPIALNTYFKFFVRVCMIKGVLGFNDCSFS